MMIGKHTFTLVVILLLALPSIALANVPTSIGYTGFLSDGEGPFDGLLDFSVAIYGGVDGDDLLWEEEHLDVELVLGAFSLTLGASEPIDAALLDGGPLFLQFTAGGDVLEPRVPLDAAVPYSRQAALADNARNPNGVAVGETEVIDGEGNWVGPAISTGSTGLEARIAALEAQVLVLEDEIDDEESGLPACHSRADALEQKTAPITVTDNGLVFTGVNVHIVNGTGFTGDANGVGNLIVGYDEASETLDRGGSHNVVIGSEHAYPENGQLALDWDDWPQIPPDIADGDHVVEGGTIPWSDVRDRPEFLDDGVIDHDDLPDDVVVDGDLSAVAKSGSWADIANVPPVVTALGDDSHFNVAPVGGTGVDLFLDGVNLHIRNGLGITFGEVNGLGNLIVGYNEDVVDSPQPRGGSHNLVVGPFHSYSSFGGLVAGLQNTVSGQYASVTGGQSNTAAGVFASATGGEDNTAEGDGASVTGGENNYALGARSSVTGGENNTAEGNRASVTAGVSNYALGTGSSVTGGASNHALGTGSSVTGGLNNTAAAPSSSIAGGQFNQTGGDDEASSIGGGWSNFATGPWATVSGGAFSRSEGDSTSVTGGEYNTASAYASSVTGGKGNTAYDDFASVSGGCQNSAELTCSSVNGGYMNLAAGTAASVSGGMLNTATGNYSSIVGGDHNRTTDDDESATVSGGRHNTAYGQGSSVTGGSMNVAMNAEATVTGGNNNTAYGYATVVTGGTGNYADGDFAVILSGDDNDTDDAWTVIVGGNFNTATGEMDVILGGVEDRTVRIEDEDFIFEGLNVHVRNGQGATWGTGANWAVPGTPNGLGNLIVGYNESTGSQGRGGSHNLVVGPYHSYPHFGGLVAGVTNTLDGHYASVSGGMGNTAGGNASVSGGQYNTASGLWSSVSGGDRNIAEGMTSTVSGGQANIASGGRSSVSGGGGNTAAHSSGWVAGTHSEEW